MGEEQYISRLGELNRIIEHYSEQIVDLTDRVGETTINKVVVTDKMIKVLKSRMIELKRERDELEGKLLRYTA